MSSDTIHSKKVVVIGGGTGTYTVLRGLKHYPDLKLTAVVTTSDDGGSNKKFRDEFGLLPPSDFRQCLVALADESRSNSILRELMMFRFNQGVGLEGQTFGNILIAALSEIKGSQLKAFAEVGKLLNIKGEILPVTTENIRLMAEYEDGSIAFGEHLIDEPEDFHDSKQRIKRLFTNRGAQIYSETERAILEADCIIFGPGDLYTSTLANLVVDGVTRAIMSSKAKVVQVLNIMTKYGQTYGLTACDHVNELQNYLGRLPDYIIWNSSSDFPEEILASYAKIHDFPVKDDLNEMELHGSKVMRADLISGEIAKKADSDKLKRSLIRHDSYKLANVLYQEILSGK